MLEWMKWNMFFHRIPLALVYILLSEVSVLGISSARCLNQCKFLIRRTPTR